MVFSIILYGLIISFVTCLSCIAQIKNKQYFNYIVIIILSTLIGFRNYSVGIDTPVYYEKIYYIINGNSEYVYGLETTFKYLCSSLSVILNDVTSILFLFAILTISLVVFRLWDFKNIASYPFMMFVFCSCFMFYSFNIMRQMCAVAIIFYATRYLEKDNIKKFLLLSLSSLFFHYSGVLAILYLGIYLFTKSSIKNIIKTMSLCTVVAMIIINSGIADYLIIKQQSYFHLDSMRVGVFLPFKFALFIISYITFIQCNHSYINKYLNITFAISMLGIVLTSVGYVFAFMERLGLYFYIFECCFIGILTYKWKYSLLFKTIYFLIIAMELIISIINNSQGQVPYSTIF